MKKSMIVALALASALMILCAACGGSETAEVSATVSPETEDETVTVTPPPADEDDAAPVVTAEPEAQSDTTDDADAAEDVPEDLTTAQGMIGQSVSELYAAIGEPESSEYTESCLVEDGEDGLLYYDGFIVSTVRYADGTEVVMGAY